jgi:tetratricopeptide (TPR) repeat protein
MLALKASKKTIESLEVAKALAEKNPRHAALQIAYAVALMGVQKYDEAYPILTNLSKLKVPAPNENYAVIIAALGECQLYLGKHGEASISLNEALKHIPNAARFMVILGEVQVKSGKFDLAKANLEQALGINSSYDRALYLLRLLSEKENSDRARLYYEKALEAGEKGIEIVSDNGSEHYMLYQICQRLGMQEKAEEYKKSAAELHFTHEAPWKPGVKPIP